MSQAPTALPSLEAVQKLHDLTGRVALVTGGGSGLGRAMAWGLACHGATLAIIDRDAAIAATCAHEITKGTGARAIAVQADVSKEADVERAAAAGARQAFTVLLRLPAEVLPVFQRRMEEVLPGRAAPVLAALTEMRAGALQESRFTRRMRGEGERYRALAKLIDILCRKHGLELRGDEGLESLRPRARQAQLFDEPGP